MCNWCNKMILFSLGDIYKLPAALSLLPLDLWLTHKKCNILEPLHKEARDCFCQLNTLENTSLP